MRSIGSWLRSGTAPACAWASAPRSTTSRASRSRSRCRTSSSTCRRSTRCTSSPTWSTRSPDSKGYPMNAPTTPDLDLAVLHHLRGDIEGAEEGYRSVLAATPDNATALNNLGFAAAQSGRFDEAAALYERSIAVDDRATAHLNLGNVRAAMGDLEGGIAELSRATELAPSDTTA